MALKKAIAIVDRITCGFEVVCEVLLALMVLVATYCFIGRYFLNSSPQWGEPLATMCFVWIAMLTSAIAIKRGTHIKLELIDKIVPPVVGNILVVIAHIGVAVFAFFLIRAGYAAVQLTARNIMPGIGIKTAWLYASVPVSGIVSYLSLFGKLLETIDARRGGIVE